MASVGEGRGGRRPHATSTRAPAVALAPLFPNVIAALPQGERSVAERVLVVPRLSASDEDLAETFSDAPDDTFGFLVVEGIVIKETTLATRSALEVLGPGDILAPPLSAPRQREARAVSRYVAYGSVSLAVLEGHVRAAGRKWPELAGEVHDRLARQTHRASAHMAMLHASRVDDRIELLFADLAERCGRVTPEGILVDVPLTHELVGRLVGAQRPTVTLAMGELARAGSLRRLEGGGWLIPSGSEAARRLR